MTARAVALLVTALLAAPACTPGGSGDPRDRALRDRRSLLAFVPHPVESGRFTLRVEGRDEVRWRGVFWRTGAGNAYTRIEPYDRELVRREVGALADRVRREAAARSPDEPYFDPAKTTPLVTGDFYDGDEFQYALDEYLAESLGPATLSFAVIGKEPACPRGYDAHVAAVRRAVAGLVPRWTQAPDGEERWRIDVVALRRATSGTRHEVERVCADNPADIATSGDDAVESPAVEVARRPERLSFRFLSRDGTTDRSMPHLTIDVTAGGVGRPPRDPDPAPVDGVVKISDFLLAVAACGALPWEYSDFAAGNDYTAPTAKGYAGPTIFSTRWACAGEVPARDRAKPD